MRVPSRRGSPYATSDQALRLEDALSFYEPTLFDTDDPALLAVVCRAVDNH